MWSVSMICNKQECKALYSWLDQHDYCSHQERSGYPYTEFYINCDAKIFSMVVFIGYNNNNPKSKFSSTDTHVACTGFTQLINTILTIHGMPKYKIYELDYSSLATVQDIMLDTVCNMRLDVVIDSICAKKEEPVTYGQSIENIMNLKVSKDFRKEESEDIPF